MIERIAALRTALEETGCDAFVSVSPPSNQYLTGLMTSFMEISSGIVITATEAQYLCDFRYTEQSNDQVAGYEITEIKGDLLVRLGECLNKVGATKAAYDPSGVTASEFDRLGGAFSGELVAQPDLVAGLRIIKSPEEIDAIRSASNLAQGVLDELIPTLEAGITERELSAQFEYEFKKRGASSVSFDMIALFGARSSLPHGEPGSKRLEGGDIILLDFGCRREGYCSDLTRTYVFGSIPGAWFDEIYSVTLEAQLKSLEAVRPGASCREVDAVARDIISDGGFGAYFGHGLGHGVGIEIHEWPRFNKESEAILEVGMVMTIEPGIYLPDRGGVRIEDLLVVTEEGCEVFTTTPKDLKVLAG